MKGCSRIREKFDSDVHFCILWKHKEFEVFQASKFSKLGIKARNPAGHSMSNHPMTYTSPSSILMKLAVYIRPIETCRNSKCQLDWSIGYRVMAFSN